MTTEYTHLELNATQRPFDYNEPNRRLSWDDFTVFYQNANAWDYPVEDTLSSSQSNKSQNPSPKIDPTATNSNNNNHTKRPKINTEPKPRPIDDNDDTRHKHKTHPSIMGVNSNKDEASETDDPDNETSSSSGPIRVLHDTGTRHSMEEDIVESDEDNVDQSSSISLPHDEVNKDQDEMEYNDDARTVEEIECEEEEDGQEIDALSISLSSCDGDDDDDDEKEENVMVEVNGGDTTNGRLTQEDQDMKVIVMELKINDLNEKVVKLMQKIRELTDRNNYLELSKMELIVNTANAMNDYRETVKKLNKQNKELLRQIKYRSS